MSKLVFRGNYVYVTLPCGTTHRHTLNRVPTGERLVIRRPDWAASVYDPLGLNRHWASWPTMGFRIQPSRTPRFAAPGELTGEEMYSTDWVV